MAALTTLALLAVAAAKTGIDYSSQRAAARSVDAQGGAQGALLDKNADLADAQAADAITRGNQDAGRVIRQSRLLSGSQRAALAAQGINVDSGSAADVVTGDAKLGETDALTIRNNAHRDAWGFQQQASGYRMQADWARQSGHNQAQGIRRQSVGTLLGGAGELANIWASAPKSVGAGSGGSSSPPAVPKAPARPTRGPL